MSLDRKNEIQAELIAQMVCAGVDPINIAKGLSLSRPRLRMIMKTPEYQEIEQRIVNHSKQVMEEIADERLKKRLALRVEVEDAVSEAIHLLLAALREKKDLRAALEILDRDPRHDFTKASRQVDKKDKTPPISPEALSTAIKEAGITHNIIEASQKLQ